ncbi:MAG TPA: SGNH/GDSL hydrolase family protein [Polyangiaceae bacterium]|nr:SGNH/GDSL hydrolase family protein [Polyangiaceae bacterium]
MSRRFATTGAGLTMTWMLLACEADPPPLTPVGALPTIESTALEAPVATEPVCHAPSLDATGELDAREEAALEPCRNPDTGPGRLAKRCGLDGPEPDIPLDALEEAVIPFDRATREHLRAVAARGRELGRNPHAFGLVGDSMTVSGAFMRPYGTDEAIVVAPELEPSLWSETTGGSIFDWYRGYQIERFGGRWRDSFTATRAARVGARTPWAVEGGAMSPLANMVERISPAVAIVLFGGNDAAYRVLPFDQLADRFQNDLERVIDQLEERGVIVVLNTIARHGDSPGFRNCGASREMSDWRLAVQTNLLSARVADLACERHLPLIDVRHAMDTAINLGLGSDGVHPSYFARGAGVLDARALRCGYNVRNFVTMKMLAEIVDLVFSKEDR